MSLSKSAWREILLARRSALNAQARDEETRRVVCHAAALCAGYSGHTVIGLYHPVRGELDPLGVAAENRAYCLPKIMEQQLRFMRWHQGTSLVRGAYGIAEPGAGEAVVPTLVFVPLLGVDENGYRLGYGKGYYDRYFAEQGKETRRIGLAFTCQQVDGLPAEAHDMPLHLLITAEGVREFP